MNAKPAPIVISSPPEMRDWSRARRLSGGRIGFVPTMGALHDGHLSLFRSAASRTDAVVVSIFVNPAQFGPREDFLHYPRNPQSDLDQCRSAAVDVVFVPAVEAMYLSGHSVVVDETALSQGLCGTSRPGHFRGVLTVVAKLFNIVQPDLAVFGRKDAQQAALIQRMVHDLHFPIELVIAPILRDADGLAMSSRNRYLSDGERRQALAIPEALRCVAEYVRKGGTDAETACNLARKRLSREPDLRLDYLVCVNAETLAPAALLTRGVMVAVAAWVGHTRLIDNILPIEESS